MDRIVRNSQKAREASKVKPAKVNIGAAPPSVSLRVTVKPVYSIEILLAVG